MAETIEAFALTTDREPRSALRTVEGRYVLRTLYPSLANEQSCVTCHNQLQPGKPPWRLNDVMGAFAIDVPIGAFVTALRNESYTIGLSLFLVLGAIGLIISVLHFHQLNEREAASSEWRTQNVRFNAALNNMLQGLCMFDANRRLVVSNERHPRMYALPPELLEPGTTHDTIIKHRVANAILAGDQSEAAVAQKLTDLNKHSVKAKSSWIDKLADGRLVKVTRDPMPGGGWVATHEDVTERAHRELIDSAISSFRERVEAMLKTVNESTKSMKSTAAKLFGSSERTSQRAKGIVEASQGTSTNVQNAAAATRQMSASAEEISQQIAQTSNAVRDAVGKVQATNDEFVGLSNATRKIGDVVKLIQEISGQTNLLALNATIEAARAGAAGRGFAVVASEVKSLAWQTGHAAEEVIGQILAVQTSTEGALQAVGGIEACIGEIGTYASSVAGSIEQQGVATVEISHSVENAAQETGKIAAVLGEVADAAVETRTSAEIVLAASESVEGAVESLRREVEDFFSNVAA